MLQKFLQLFYNKRFPHYLFAPRLAYAEFLRKADWQKVSFIYQILYSSS